MDDDIASIQTGLRDLSDGLSRSFGSAVGAARPSLPGEALLAWARESLALARCHTPVPVEAAQACFRATPDVLDRLGPEGLLRWTKRGKRLCRDSPGLAAAYFRASPAALAALPQAMVDVWLEMGPGLYRRTPEAMSLAARIMDAMPRLLSLLSLAEIERLTFFLDRLADASAELAADCLDESPRVLGLLGKRARPVFLSLLLTLVRLNPRAAAAFFTGAATALEVIEGDTRGDFLALTETVARSGAQNALALLQAGSEAFCRIDPGVHGGVVSRARGLSASPPAVTAFLRSWPAVTGEIGIGGLERWVDEGRRLLERDTAAALAHFRLDSGVSTLHPLLARVSLEEVRDVLLLYGQALAGAPFELRPGDGLPAWSMGLIREGVATGETAVILPPFVDRYGTEEENFAWYKVALTHQVGHMEFGSFGFSFEREAALFDNRRRRLGSMGETHVTDMERFLGLFDDGALAADLFSVAEDLRVDHLVKRSYPGISASYRAVQREALARRPSFEGLSMRRAFVELLVRMSLGDEMGEVPAGLDGELCSARQILGWLSSPSATVEDSAEAALRLYDIASGIPGVVSGHPEAGAITEGDPDAEVFPHEALFRGTAPYPPAVELEYHAPAGVEFRGALRPELRHLQVEMGDGPPAAASMPASPPAGKTRLREVVEGENAPSGLFVTDLPEMPSGIRTTPVSGVRSAAGHDSAAPSLAGDAASFLYHEWDYRVGRYLADWCRVTEMPLPEGGVGYFEETLTRNAALAARVRRRLEMLIPGSRRKVNRLHDGEGIDLDAAITACVDRKAGQVPDARVYWKRRRTERDVATILLLDMSASTDEAVPSADDRERYPEWYLDMMWDRPGPEPGRHPAQSRRVIDVARESLVVMASALEAIGDRYGVYGFSGHGRENVQMLAVKGLDERFTDAVKRRLGGIHPLYGTRMGPAIRHATTRLEACDARTRIIFLLSDGYPQDKEYGRDGNDREYALQDTRMALAEARRKGITPFCLTVDVCGHDYLRRMAGDVAYEVVNDMEALPERLAALYTRLTS